MTTYQAYNTKVNLFVGWFGTYTDDEQLKRKLKEWKAPEYVISKEV